MKRLIRWEGLHIAILFCAALFALAGNVSAQFDSGWRWWGDVTGPEGCRGMYLRANQSNVSTSVGGVLKTGGNTWNEARVCVPGGARQGLPAGWIGAAAVTYRDGGYCGSSGWKYNSGGNATATADHTNCVNPSGVQSWYTDAMGRIWNGSVYLDYYAQPSLPASF